MAIRIQSDYPEVTKNAGKSPMLSNLSSDHQAWVHPMQSYIWMHDKYKACLDIFDIEMPEVQIKRFELLRHARFMEDHSGRSTGKTHNYLVDLAITSICCNLHETVWLGQAKDVGVKIFDTYPGEWIEYIPEFKRFTTAKGNHKAKVSHDQSGATVRFFNGSIMQSISPDSNKAYKKMQTWRFNHGVFNEWPNWPYIREIPDKIEPVFTKTNRHYRKTRMFREAMERVLGIELGRLSNEDLSIRHKVKGFEPRDYIDENLAPKPWARIQELFYANFEKCFGFDYCSGVTDIDLQFNSIESENDIIIFFKDYDEGDPAYLNKLIYDGSAKRPSDDCFWLHKFFTDQVKAGDKLYAQYRIGVDDIPREYDGIIFDSTTVAKARKTELAEDFKRIWMGHWTEGRAKNPFAWVEVVNASVDGWLGQLRSDKEGGNYAGSIDSAQGTDATFKTDEGVSDGRGDDGVAVIYELGAGTPESPHKLCYVKIAEDVRSEPWAYDVQDVESNFGALFYMLDPGGGGKGLLEKLAKTEVKKTDITGEEFAMDVIPMLPWDHENPGDSKANICIFSMSNEMITTPYIDTKTQKALFQYADQLNNYMVKLMQDAVKDKTVAFPAYLEENEIIELYNNKKISDDQLANLIDIRKSLSQLVHLRYETDRSGRRKKTSHGVFTYTAPGKKDAAMTIMMGYMMCDIIVRMAKMQNEDGDNSGMIPDVE